METKRRSIAKAMSWRFFATLTTCAIVFILTGESEFALTVGIFDTAIKILIYFFHERAWLKISYGKPEQLEYQI